MEGRRLMHEHGVMKSLMRQIEETARAERARRVTGISVTLGALSHMTVQHFGEHFDQVAAGTIAEGAMLSVTAASDIRDPRAADVILTGIEVETED
jgi:hydrogenase nickel incorporation protein HypA/HybF